MKLVIFYFYWRYNECYCVSQFFKYTSVTVLCNTKYHYMAVLVFAHSFTTGPDQILLIQFQSMKRKVINFQRNRIKARMVKCGRCIVEEEAGMACLTCPCSSTVSSITTTAKKAKSDLNMEDLIVLDMMQLQNLCMNGNLQVGVEFYRCGKYTPLLAGNREQSNSDRQAAAQVPSV